MIRTSALIVQAILIPTGLSIFICAFPAFYLPSYCRISICKKNKNFWGKKLFLAIIIAIDYSFGKRKFLRFFWDIKCYFDRLLKLFVETDHEMNMKLLDKNLVEFLNTSLVLLEQMWQGYDIWCVLNLTKECASCSLVI